MQVTSTDKQVKVDVVDQGEAILERLCHRESAIYCLPEPRNEAKTGI